MPFFLSAFARDLVLVAVYNTAIGLFLTALTHYTLPLNLIYAHCIGFGIYFAVRGPGLLRGSFRVGWLAALIGIPFGFAGGFALASWMNGLAIPEVLSVQSDGVKTGALAAALFGVLGTWYFRAEARVHEARAEAQTERLQRIEQEALAVHTQLALLQAQIEPHFLFNTLSTVLSLIDTDAPAARRMLIDLTALLRNSLARTRNPVVTLAEEIELLRAYLGIMAVRMGGRLTWRIDVSDGVLGTRLPPLLVQPLVENAIRHGLEPKTGGGHVVIRAWREAHMLAIAVVDDGCGSTGDIHEGTGLSNVRQRLTAACGSEASLALSANPGGGVTSCLHIPLDNHEPAPADR